MVPGIPWPFLIPSGTHGALQLPPQHGMKMLSGGKSGNEMLTAFGIPDVAVDNCSF